MKLISVHFLAANVGDFMNAQLRNVFRHPRVSLSLPWESNLKESYGLITYAWVIVRFIPKVYLPSLLQVG